MSSALYRAHHVYRLGYKRLGRRQYLVLQGFLALVLIGGGLAPIVANTLRADPAHADAGYAITGDSSDTAR
ncbi:MAG: hypothetical protein WDN27_05080 [Candidatus Saccharibacteria bacterium]